MLSTLRDELFEQTVHSCVYLSEHDDGSGKTHQYGFHSCKCDDSYSAVKKVIDSKLADAEVASITIANLVIEQTKWTKDLFDIFNALLSPPKLYVNVKPPNKNGLYVCETCITEGCSRAREYIKGNKSQWCTNKCRERYHSEAWSVGY